MPDFPILAHKPYARAPVPPKAEQLPNWLSIELGNIARAIPPLKVVMVTSDYRPTVLDDTIVVDATAGPVSITLNPPTQVGYQAWTIVKVDSSGNAVTIVGTVSGVVNPTLATQWKSMTVKSSGVLFLKVASV